MQAHHAAVALELIRKPGLNILECMETVDGQRTRQVRARTHAKKNGGTLVG